MKANIIEENMMNQVYEKNSWLYWNVNKHNVKKDSLAGCLSKSTGYYVVKINGKKYFNHRILYQIYNNVTLKETDIIDHINGITTDNRKQNLRIVTDSQSMMNRKTQKHNKSTKIKNIYILHRDYYYIKIKKDGKIVFSKCYKTDFFTLDDMIKIRDEKLKELHGEFASFG